LNETVNSVFGETEMVLKKNTYCNSITQNVSILLTILSVQPRNQTTNLLFQSY